MKNKEKHSTETEQPFSAQDGGEYEIKVRGVLDDHWETWFEGMNLKQVTNGEIGQECTLITGLIVDQPALHGLLAKIGDLNLTLISVKKIYPERLDNPETD
jgi:wyosine [tRNA(Phe)-imidazoG37] synthetase (radical SAM superfamily)